MVYQSISFEETQNIGEEVAKKFVNSGGVIALIGGLGAGKTTFARGFAKELNIKDKIISPTFILMRQHPIPSSKKVLYHLDLYRLEGEINIEELGLKELFVDPEAIVLIEWAEKIHDALPKDSLIINFKNLSENRREIEVLEL